VVVYLGPVYEVNATTGVTTSYYFFGGQRVAMRQGAVVYWLHGDHLGSASLTTSGSGQIVSQQRYKPYGQTRWISGTIPTDWRFTDQRSDEAGIGLYDYKARYLDPRIGRFISADTIVPSPGDPQSFNRYSYVLGNPLKYNDPSGHVSATQCGAESDPSKSQFCWQQRWYEARGFRKDGSGWKLDSTMDPVIDDAGIADEVLGEAGIGLTSEAGLAWTDDRKMMAARGVAKLGQRLSDAGGLGRVKKLLGGGATVHIVYNSPFECGGQQACAPPWGRGDIVYLPDIYFGTAYVHMDIVHELAHIIDWHNRIEINGTAVWLSTGWGVYPAITDYGTQYNFITRAGSPTSVWDKFAEAVTVAVFGQDYAKRSGPFLVEVSRWQTQSTRMLELLKGWR
jgi:RHS repeat-associated protein